MVLFNSRSQGETKTETVSYLMSAEPKTSQTYIISWQEVWESGVAVMQVGESAFDIPFNVKTNLIYSVSSEPGKCS